MKSDFPVYDICTLSDFKQEDIIISRFAPYLGIHKNLHLPHKHNFYHLVLFTEGGGDHAVDFTTFPVKEGQIYFMIPGQVHSWAFRGPVDGYVVNFSDAFFQSFLLKPDYLEQFAFFSGDVHEAVIDLPKELYHKARAIFEEIIEESEHAGRMNADAVRALMIRLFILISRLNKQQAEHASSNYSHTVLRNFRKLIDQNYLNLRLPKEYAELLYITPNHLNALCKDLLDTPAGELIRDRVALEAKRLLVNMDTTIAEIASKLNFADNSYFSKFFKKQTGITPEEFRKHLNTKYHENVNN